MKKSFLSTAVVLVPHFAQCGSNMVMERNYFHVARYSFLPLLSTHEPVRQLFDYIIIISC